MGDLLAIARFVVAHPSSAFVMAAAAFAIATACQLGFTLHGTAHMIEAVAGAAAIDDSDIINLPSCETPGLPDGARCHLIGKVR